MNSDISITPNNSSFGPPNFPQAPDTGPETNGHGNAWGWTLGAGIERALTPAWSVGLEYDYYRFATAHVSTPETISSTGGATAETISKSGGEPPAFGTVAASTASVTQDIQVVKLALNYHWDHDPRAAWADAPVFGMPAMAVKAHPAPILGGWEIDAGTRYWYSSGTTKNTSGSGSLVSQLTYSNLTGQSGELFARVDTPSRVFVKGYVGTGAITGGKVTDEDWGALATHDNTGFMVTSATTSGWLNYAAADVGYNVLLDRDYKIGPFIGYSYFRENVNATGLTQDETWQSLRVGVSAVATIWDRWGINGDVAYLPYAQFSGLDSHTTRVPVAFYPEDGTGRGVQAELILSYRFTENLAFGVGGRYWAFWSTNASQTCHGGCDPQKEGLFTILPSGPITTNAERFGAFVQMSYRFDTRP